MKEDTIILDSSVIIAYFRKDEAHHEKAEEIFNTHENLIIPGVIVGEALSILKMKEGLKVAEDCAYFLENSVGIRIVMTEETTFQSAMRFFISKKNNLSFIDTMLLNYAKQKGIRIATFDKELNIIANIPD